MFLGHFAVAFAAKKTAPKVSLAVLFAACQLLDLLWPIFLLIGLEHVRIQSGNTPFTHLDFYDYPISHGLVGALSWSLIFGGGYYLIKRNRKAAIIVGAVVFSHWILDWITHGPDLPLLGNDSTKVGLGLWNSVAGTVIVELGMLAVGAWIYVKATKAKSPKGNYTLIGLLIFFLLVYVSNLMGPPPSSEHLLAILANITWVFVLWAWWIDRNRIPRETPGT
jgi:hypothetical protein